MSSRRPIAALVRPRGATVVLALAVALAAALAVAIVDPGAAYRHSDFFQFWAAPRLILERADPYDPVAWAGIYAREAAAPVATPPPPERHIYPLWVALLPLPLGALPFGLAAALWLVAQLVIVALALRTLVALSGGTRRESVLLFGLAAGAQPLWLLVGGGNMTGFLFGLYVAALAATLRQRPVHAGLAIGLLALKPHPLGIAIPALLLVARDRFAIVAVAGAVVTALLAGSLALDPGWVGKWLAAAFDRLTTTGSNATVWTVGRVIPLPFIAPVLAAASVAALALWWRSRSSPFLRVAGAVPVSLFLAPHGWSYDHLFLFVAYAAILGRLALIAGPRRLTALLLTAAAAGPLPWLLYGAASVRGGEEWSAVSPLVAFGLLVLADRWAAEGRPPPAG